MNVRIDQSWKKVLNTEFEKDYFKDLITYVKKEYTEHKCFPPGAEIFAAFDHSVFDNTKVVILGQDPYHGIGQANGLCFSVKDQVAIPPSLVNIFKEIETDLGQKAPLSGNLERWANQGVLLLNATLTVRAHQAGSHQNKGWETFTDRVIQLISQEKELVGELIKLVEIENSKRKKESAKKLKAKKAKELELKKEVQKKIEPIREKKKAEKNKENLLKQQEANKPKANLKIGDRVRLEDGKAVGTIDKIEKDKALVNYGIFTTSVSTAQLELVQSAKKK